MQKKCERGDELFASPYTTRYRILQQLMLLCHPLCHFVRRHVVETKRMAYFMGYKVHSIPPKSMRPPCQGENQNEATLIPFVSYSKIHASHGDVHPRDGCAFFYRDTTKFFINLHMVIQLRIS